LRRVLHKTLGVPLFQEQAMRIAIEAANLPPRRPTACAADGDLPQCRHHRQIRIQDGQQHDRARYAPDFAKNCFDQIKGFGSYGFPESHARVSRSSSMSRHG